MGQSSRGNYPYFCRQPNFLIASNKTVITDETICCVVIFCLTFQVQLYHQQLRACCYTRPLGMFSQSTHCFLDDYQQYNDFLCDNALLRNRKKKFSTPVHCCFCSLHCGPRSTPCGKSISAKREKEPCFVNTDN